MREYEADDGLASGAACFATRSAVRILTRKDLGQCIQASDGPGRSTPEKADDRAVFAPSGFRPDDAGLPGADGPTAVMVSRTSGLGKKTPQS